LLAAPVIRRSRRAVRPCVPITLPRSLWATRSSSTVLSGPSIASTVTNSGSSTKALAISNTGARTSPPCSVGIIDSHMGGLGPAQLSPGSTNPRTRRQLQRVAASLGVGGLAQLSVQPNDCALRIVLGRGFRQSGGLRHQFPNSLR